MLKNKDIELVITCSQSFSKTTKVNTEIRPSISVEDLINKSEEYTPEALQSLFSKKEYTISDLLLILKQLIAKKLIKDVNPKDLEFYRRAFDSCNGWIMDESVCILDNVNQL